MRRWARTRFEPDDCGLKPPIETLPQIAQERAMGSLGDEIQEEGRRAGGPERGGTIARPQASPAAGRTEDPALVAIRPTPGRSLVTGRALDDIVRTATLGSYGVTGFAGGPIGRWIELLGLGRPGLAVRVDAGIEIELDLTIALGVPVAEVARQVDSAIRYAMHRALDQEVDRIVIHIDGLHVPVGGTLPQAPIALPTGIRSRDLADSGSDVA